MSFSLILKQLMEKYNVTNYRLATDLGISRGTIANYLNGETDPQSTIYRKILDYFEILEKDGKVEKIPGRSKYADVSKGITIGKEKISDIIIEVKDKSGTYQKESNRILSDQEIISRLVIQNDKLIQILERHSVTIENLSHRGSIDPKIKDKEPKNV